MSKVVTGAGGGVGGALGIAVVVMAPKFSDITFTPEEAAIMTGVLGVIFSWLVNYLPKPNPKKGT